MSELAERIQYYRKLNNMSQADLAKQLYVTTQAVSKWETGASEPDINTIAKMAKIFNITIDELYSKDTTQSQNQQVVIDKATLDNLSKRTIGVCDDCHKAIVEGEVMKTHKTKGWGYTLCEDCYIKRSIAADEARKKDNNKKRKKAWAWSISMAAIFFIIFLLVAIVERNDSTLFTAFMITAFVGAYFVLAFLFCAIMDNTPAGEIWCQVAGWGVVKMPGVIFSLSFGGILFLIITKIILFILSLALMAVCATIGFVVGGVFALFAFPVAVHRAYKHPEKTHFFFTHNHYPLDKNEKKMVEAAK